MVNDENFGELLIEGLEEAMAHQRGERPWLKVNRRLRSGHRDDLLAPESEEEEENGEDRDPRRRW